MNFGQHTLRIIIVPFLLAVGAGSCASGPNAAERERAALQQLVRDRASDVALYEAEQRRLVDEAFCPTALYFKGVGSMIVHSIALLGGPNNAYVKVRFTYVNTTEITQPVPRVELSLINDSNQLVRQSSMELSRPLGGRVTPDTAHTASIDVDVEDLYRSPGWTWALNVSVD